MATIVVPFRPNGKTRLAKHSPELARAMLDDVLAACRQVGPTVVADGEGGQGAAVQQALRELSGPVAIVNADLPCATAADVRRLLDADFAIVEAADGTTNAIALPTPELFEPLYGPGSAQRFRAAGARPVAIPN